DGRKFGICPLPGDRTYVFCPVPLGKWDDIRAHHLDEWIESHAPLGGEVVALLRAVPDFARASYDELREVRADRWAEGPVLIIGDAAHAMTPHIGQGANAAMMDALVCMRIVAEELRTGGSFERAGKRYEAVRRRFVGRVQTSARQMGAMARWSSPTGRWGRDKLVALGARFPGLQRGSLLLAAGYNPHPDEERCLAPVTRAEFSSSRTSSQGSS
ncbi:MAG: FAD-dependent oxidoreductase, partial [Polyangiaceae bacterium]